VLKSIDILIGLTVVMLMASLVVTVLTQAVMNVLQTRGKNLRDGIAGLLRQIHGELPEGSSKKVAEALLTHPLIKSAGSRFGTVIHREELTALLLELAAGNGPKALDDEVRGELCRLLAANGIGDPKETMENVRSLALQIEQAYPALSNNERYAMALLQEAQSGFLGKVNGWFDQTIDRVSDRFTNSARLVTFFGSLVIALALQLDTPALVNRLAADPALRQALVQQAMTVSRDHASQAPAVVNSGLVPQLSDIDKKNLQALSTFNVIDIPTTLGDWKSRWGESDWMSKLLGILLTAMLLSLGAPFWYNALKNLIRLRSLIAQKDDNQRLSRQSSGVLPGSSDPATAVAGPALTTIVGERGNLASIG
jgi:hypothetical protein